MLTDKSEEIKHLIEIIKDRNPGKGCGLNRPFDIDIDWTVYM